MNEQHPFAMMPMMMPPWWQHQHPQPDREDDVPGRVRVAMEFLNGLTLKTMTRGIANDVSLQELPGQELLPVEHETQAAALNMLTAYFLGKWKPTEAEKKGTKHEETLLLVDCPQCHANPMMMQACHYCHGKGKIAISQGA